jgi:hypothetical protein
MTNFLKSFRLHDMDGEGHRTAGDGVVNTGGEFSIQVKKSSMCKILFGFWT